MKRMTFSAVAVLTVGGLLFTVSAIVRQNGADLSLAGAVEAGNADAVSHALRNGADPDRRFDLGEKGVWWRELLGKRVHHTKADTALLRAVRSAPSHCRSAGLQIVALLLRSG